jgi:glucose/arabinose dehydrogenase
VGFPTTVVTLKSGEEYTGVLQTVDEKVLEVMGADGKPVRIDKTRIQSQQASSVSLMPEGLSLGLTFQEFGDLVEFLTSLRQPESAQAIGSATPVIIPELLEPVGVSKLFKEDFTSPRIGGVESGLTGAWQVPGHPDRWLITHQAGFIWLVEKRGSEHSKSLFLDQVAQTYSKTGPNGLLGVAFHPEFPSNRKYYLKYQVFESEKISTVIEEREMADDFRHDSKKPGRRLISIPSIAGDHGGGCLEFGPDKYLYFAMGDSGPHRDPNGHAQNPQLLLGKMSRIDVDHSRDGLPYGIPRDNPFVAHEGIRPEIWASGLRNPWRFSFDQKTGDLWLADVGQDRVEEIDLIRKGQNYGWNIYEGFERFSDVYRQTNVSYATPIMAYKRKYGNSITGGYVYRGAVKAFQGIYIFGDFTSKLVFGMRQENGKLERARQLTKIPQRLVSFARDQKGEIYAVGFEGGIYKLELGDADFNGPIKE